MAQLRLIDTPDDATPPLPDATLARLAWFARRVRARRKASLRDLARLHAEQARAVAEAERIVRRLTKPGEH